MPDHPLKDQAGQRERRRGPRPWARRQPPDKLIVPQEADTFAVLPNQGGMRLDQFLKIRLRWRSRTKVQSLIEKREITADGLRVGRSYRVKVGQKVRIPLPPPPEEAFRIDEIPLDIIYEDDLLIVLNKQPDIVVHPVGRHRYDTLINALHLRYRDLNDPDNDIIPKLAHRIDRETSGVLVCCKTKRYQRGMPVVFEHADVRKEYLAIAEGVLEDDSGTIDLPIGREPGKDAGTGLQIITPDGAAALTGYQVLERFDAFSLVRARLFTGRQHQIRVHLKAIGHPIVCDKQYGIRKDLWLSDVSDLRPGEEDALALTRQALHSRRITFRHPGNGRTLVLEAPLPPDMEQTLRALRRK